jgi:D-sedoheptulose 7-phosphate isomerase
MTYIANYLNEVSQIAERIDQSAVENIIKLLLQIRKNGGRLFFLGVGGGAGNATHAVNDFRKICGIESYSACDNVSELTARINDDGWESVFTEWLKGCRLNRNDGVFIFSVGGGDEINNISVNLIRALQYAKSVGAKILGIVGREGGFTGKVADACLIIPVVNINAITPHTEEFQSVVWHLIVSHPEIRLSEMKWESIKQKEE